MDTAIKTTIAARKVGSSTVSSPRKMDCACAQSLCKKFREPAPSELHEYGQVDPILNFLKVRCESWNEGSRRSANIFDNGRCRAGRRCNSSGSREVRHIGRAVIELPAECNVLARHVVKRAGSVPGLERVSRIFREVRRAGSRRRAIDRGQQHQIAPRIVNFAAAQRQTVAVMV